MKKINLLAVALAAFTMFSCSNEEIADLGSNAPGEKATLTIKVEGAGNNVAQSRAAGSAGTTTDVVINDYIVFIFRDGGALDCPAYYSSSNAAATITNGTTAAKTAYVIANTGALANGPFANVTTEADLKAVTGDLISGNAATQTKNNLWMSGTDDITFSGTDGSVTVQLGFVAAKIELIVKDNRTNLTGGTIEIADENVVLLYAGKSGKFFGTTADKAAQTAFYSGDVSYPDFQAGVATESAVLKDAVGATFTANANGDVFNHFYTFGNDGTSKPTILAIQSKRTVGGADETIYYPIQFTVADAGNTIEPGNAYTVTLTLSGDVDAGGGGGTTNPEQPLVKSQITVTVTAATWLAKTVSKDFN